jgi:hypothetical protein
MYWMVFRKALMGAEGIFKQCSGLTASFGQTRRPIALYATAYPDFFFVQFSTEIEINPGGKCENDYLSILNGRAERL